MKSESPFVLSIAGFDPSGGAGVLADIKTFEMNKVRGLGICSCLTFQNESEFDGLEWVSLSTIKKQAEALFRKYDIRAVKIGLIESPERLGELLDFLAWKKPNMNILWDPVLKASAGYDFHPSASISMWTDLLRSLSLVTPNLQEATRLAGIGDNPFEAASILSALCPVLLKGGHREDESREDLLLVRGRNVLIAGEKIENGEKHGSGCVLSSAIAANLALTASLEESCRRAKVYVSRFLGSSSGLLGFHSPNPTDKVRSHDNFTENSDPKKVAVTGMVSRL
jgi:hydroxymethylpyrimidine/phosphomethylpyrimidine kinase